jgi:2-polyprenyl-6-hydroxyphenyl methylase/3-demethylubiquinone-9 3-methyltransferase
MPENSSESQFINEKAISISQEYASFSFGENWKKYLSSFSESTIKHAENSFTTFTGLSNMEDHTFLDIGCGSGLSSLIAYRLGAKKVLSVDIDSSSIACVTALRTRFASDAKRWDILQGSVLDRGFLASLGHFSYVYSWGVLHHTGFMWQALNNVIKCVESGGRLHLALYNEHKNSALWLKVKRICNRWPRTIFPVLKMSYELAAYTLLLVRFQSPIKFIRQYQVDRGMSFRRDVEDWLGGLPYEYCKPGQVIEFLSHHGFVLLRLRTSRGRGCNEFLFRSESFPNGK